MGSPSGWFIEEPAMKWIAYLIAVAGILNLGGLAMSAEDGVQERQKPKNRLEPFSHVIEQAVMRYYPEAVVSSSHDEKSGAETLHFEYNTQSFVMRYRAKDGSWEEPKEVRGPYVGGIWCDMVLEKGRDADKMPDAEEGVTEAGPDFYSRRIVPYSKKLDCHLKVTLRYPGGTPPEFLERFDELAKSFERHLGAGSDGGTVRDEKK
jgi:hypothetical protein